MGREIERLDRAHIKTIHGFCTGILREYPVEAAVDPAFTILDEYETSEILERVVHEVVVGELDSSEG
ncbi:MAG: UvrD-helicase domain-containing protein, partial [Deltaproteobacteria bacterium]|nr:UvrD-helicase domain-containing protein [Deltaproteobacteria bacterium]